MEEIERLHSNKVEHITKEDIAKNLTVSNRAVEKSLQSLVRDGIITRVMYCDHKGTHAYYTLKKGKETEGFINDVFEVIARIIH